MKEGNNDVQAAQGQDVHLQYKELQNMYNQQQFLIEKQMARTEHLIEELVIVKQQLKIVIEKTEALTNENKLLKDKYEFHLQQSAQKELQLENTIMELRAMQQVGQPQKVHKQAVLAFKSEQKDTSLGVKAEVNIKSEKTEVKKVTQINTPSVTIKNSQPVQQKKKLVTKPTLSKQSISNTLKEILTQEEKVVADHFFRADEDEHRFAEALKQHLLHKQHETKMLVGNMVTTYEKLHEEKTLEELHKVPYFARMDFKVGKENKTFYIGKHPVDSYVIPWQSRVAKAFYTLSMEEEFALNREMTGKLDYRRNIDFENGKIKYLHEPETIENTTNRAVVHRIENKRGKEMEAIVDTIQKQQYEIIALPITKPIIVQGSAGSGKSAIALHRLSYILANHKQLSEKNIAIFTPNEAFLHHIKKVLPELGHEQIQQFTLPQFITRRTGGKWSNRQEDEKLGVKATVAYGEQLELDILLLLQQQASFHEAITVQLDQVDITITASTLAKVLQRLEKYPQHKKRAVGKKLLEKALDDCVERKAVEELCHFSSEHLTANNRLYLVKHGKASIVEAFTKQYRRYEQQLVITVANQLLDWTGPFERAHMAPLLHTYMIVNGKRPIFEYVIVDEAQDYTPYEIWLLNQLCKEQNIMLVGDMGQAIQPYYQPDSWQAYEQAIGDYELHCLTHTYRSTMQIVEEANKIILPISNGKFEVSTFNPRLGSDVREEHVPFELLESRVTYWVEQYMDIGYKSFAFITMDPDVKFDVTIPVITTNEYSKVTGPKLVVGNPLELKGLEFDAVFVDELAPFPSSDYGQKLKYVAYTRALHQLHLFKTVLTKFS